MSGTIDDPRGRDAGTAYQSIWSQNDVQHRLLAAVRDILDVRSVRQAGSERPMGPRSLFRPAGDAVELRGRLLVPSQEAFEVVSARLRPLGYLPLFRRWGGDDVILAMPGELPAARGRHLLAIVLFLATFASVLLTGGLNALPPDAGAAGLLRALSAIALSGLPFAASLMGILLAHELGHYLVCRRLGVPASPPFFIPLPLTLFGTMGAVMQMKAPPRDRRALLAVAAAGPLAGLAVSIPVLVLGLSLSPVLPQLPSGMGMQEGNSLLYAGLKYMVFGRLLPSGGLDVFLHPVALAGWAGLFVTGLNLIPAGQLDGGHIAYVLLGSRARYLTWPIVLALAGLGTLYWQGWLLWAVLVMVFGQVHAVPLDDLTALRPRERALAALMLVVFVLVFMPIPMAPS